MPLPPTGRPTAPFGTPFFVTSPIIIPNGIVWAYWTLIWYTMLGLLDPPPPTRGPIGVIPPYFPLHFCLSHIFAIVPTKSNKVWPLFDKISHLLRFLLQFA